jgi:selenoprotein W-related protein
MKEFRHELSEIELIPWYDGSFDVTVDGELVHSMYREGGFPDHSVVFEAVRRHQTAPLPEKSPSNVPQEG